MISATGQLQICPRSTDLAVLPSTVACCETDTVSTAGPPLQQPEPAGPGPPAKTCHANISLPAQQPQSRTPARTHAVP